MSSLNDKSITYFLRKYISIKCIMLNILVIAAYQFLMFIVDLDANHTNMNAAVKHDIIVEGKVNPNMDNILLEMSLAKEKKYGMVIIQLLNSGYVEMTKNWLCNVNQISTKVIPRLILIATDENAEKELKKFKTNTGINYDVVFHPFPSNTNLKYGDYEYFRLELERLKLQNYLIQKGITIFMTESDATWFTNGDLVIDEFDKLLQKYDMITTNDCYPPVKGCISVGFMAFKGNIAVQRFFQRYYDEHRKHLLSLKGKGRLSYNGSAQIMLMNKIKKTQNIGINWTFASDKRYSNGKWYNYKELRTNDILVVQNNWIVGNANKVLRAKQYNQWFTDGQICLSPSTPIIDERINPLPKHILPELPILTNMVCDESYNIDSKESKKKADKSRSCLFTEYSLCYNLKRKNWIYYTYMDAFSYDISGKLSTLRLPVTLNNTINLRFASDTPKSFEKVTSSNKFNFTIDYNYTNYMYYNTFFSDVMTIFGETTTHGENIAHAIFECWFKIYMAIDNFIYDGIIYDNTSINVIVKKLPKAKKYNGGPIPQRFRQAYEPILFNDVIYGLNELHRKYSKHDQICFKNIVIGTNEYSGLLDAIHTNNQLVRYIRKKILNYYGLNDLYKPKKINILFIKKSNSYWGRDEFIFNLLNNEIIISTKQRYSSYNEINVMSLDPKKEDIGKQIKILYESLIIISPIGGIGYTNFLQPLNGVQVYLIKWGIHPGYLPEHFKETFIPENDHEFHNAQTMQTILKYADLSDKYNYTKGNWTWNIKDKILFNVIDKAIWLIRERFNIIATV